MYKNYIALYITQLWEWETDVNYIQWSPRGTILYYVLNAVERDNALKTSNRP